jgi:hypothetical protein
MATQQDRYEFPALRRRLTLLQQELYEAEKMLSINSATQDSGNVLMRYQMSQETISREIDELTWLLQYADRQLRAAEQWPAHYWALFIVLAGIGAVLTLMLINQFV